MALKPDLVRIEWVQIYDKSTGEVFEMAHPFVMHATAQKPQ
jgi:hypothetical protein